MSMSLCEINKLGKIIASEHSHACIIPFIQCGNSALWIHRKGTQTWEMKGCVFLSYSVFLLSM